LPGNPLLFGTFKGECGVGAGNFGNDLQVVAAKITAKDAEYLNTIASQLNGILSQAAGLALAEGIPVTFVSVSPYFNGHRLCDSGNSWIKPFSGGVLFHGALVGFDSGSFHPTLEGAVLGYETALLDTDIGH
jgi:hypothetical protein